MGIVNYSRDGELVEITVRGPNGEKIEKHVCNLKEKKKYAQIIAYLRDKYGFEPIIDVRDSINSIEDEKKDLDWWGKGEI